MSKCKKCNNELNGMETIAWFDGLCEKCWQEEHYIKYQFKKGIKEKDDEMVELKQQLAEKDKEIEKYRNANIIVVGGRSQGKKHLMEIKIKEIQNQKAIEQLEKVKEFFLEEHRDEEMDTDYIITKDAGEIADYLLDQIKQLKEGK